MVIPFRPKNHEKHLLRSILKLTMAVAMVFQLTGCVSTADQKQEDDKTERNANTHVRLGVGYLRQGKPELALEKLQKALEIKSDYAPAHSALALVYEQLQMYDKADDYYQEAIDLDPSNGGMFNNYGVFLCKQNRLVEAEKYFLKAVNTPRYSTPELAYENAGSCAMKIPDINKAEKFLQIALDRNPKLPSALFHMAQVRFEQKRFLSSRGFLQRFEAVSSHHPQSLWLGIRVERQLGDVSAAKQYAKQLQSKFPKSEEFKLLLNTARGENQS